MVAVAELAEMVIYASGTLEGLEPSGTRLTIDFAWTSWKVMPRDSGVSKVRVRTVPGRRVRRAVRRR